ncbi:MAG: hypothetical protein HYX79_10970 [Chloroflexi bacterium]|nr:hypothetical protein [Chloroflexota bacterium]
MSEWLAKPEVTEEDIKRSQPNIVEFFPMLTRYYVDDGKMRLVYIMSHEEREKFVPAVTKTYGSFSPANMRKAFAEAVAAWIKSKS